MVKKDAATAEHGWCQVCKMIDKKNASRLNSERPSSVSNIVAEPSEVWAG
jgi:recombinational DNA repair protein RecR